jgi:hypothetical protein
VTLTITSRIIRSPATRHIAELVQGSAEWRVSWLPARPLAQDQAVAAMELAEAVGQIPADCDPEVYDEGFWSRVDALAAKLGMSASAAVGRASKSPEDAGAGGEPG